MKTKTRVLIVEDDPEMRGAIRRVLGRGGHEILTAKNGSEGLAMARAHKPDLVVLDILMPVLDGYDVCAELSQDSATSDIPIMMVTSLSDKANVSYGLDFGADDYLAKPFEADELRARVKSLIAGSRH